MKAPPSFSFDFRARLLEVGLEASQAAFWLETAPLQGLRAIGFGGDEIAEIKQWRDGAWLDRAVGAIESAPRNSELRGLLDQALSSAAEDKARVVAAAADLMTPARFRRPAVNAPRGRRYIVRKVGQVPSPSPWWLRWGTHAKDVHRWLVAAEKSPNPVEAEIVRRLRHRFLRRGFFDERVFRREFGAYALAFCLWYAQFETSRVLRLGPELVPGYHGVVYGKPRGELARLLGNQAEGLPVGVRRISQYLRWLRAWLDGILEFHQPSPASVGEHPELPHAKRWWSDGDTDVQAYNIYWFRNAAFMRPASIPGDLRSSYVEELDHTRTARRSANDRALSHASAAGGPDLTPDALDLRDRHRTPSYRGDGGSGSRGARRGDSSARAPAGPGKAQR
jgi:hypothetical protein